MAQFSSDSTRSSTGSASFAAFFALAALALPQATAQIDSSRIVDIAKELQDKHREDDLALAEAIRTTVGREIVISVCNCQGKVAPEAIKQEVLSAINQVMALVTANIRNRPVASSSEQVSGISPFVNQSGAPGVVAFWANHVFIPLLAHAQLATEMLNDPGCIAAALQPDVWGHIKIARWQYSSVDELVGRALKYKSDEYGLAQSGDSQAARPPSGHIRLAALNIMLAITNNDGNFSARLSRSILDGILSEGCCQKVRGALRDVLFWPPPGSRHHGDCSFQDSSSHTSGIFGLGFPNVGVNAMVPQVGDTVAREWVEAFQSALKGAPEAQRGKIDAMLREELYNSNVPFSDLLQAVFPYVPYPTKVDLTPQTRQLALDARLAIAGLDSTDTDTNTQRMIARAEILAHKAIHWRDLQTDLSALTPLEMERQAKESVKARVDQLEEFREFPPGVCIGPLENIVRRPLEADCPVYKAALKMLTNKLDELQKTDANAFAAWKQRFTPILHVILRAQQQLRPRLQPSYGYNIDQLLELKEHFQFPEDPVVKALKERNK